MKILTTLLAILIIACLLVAVIWWFIFAFKSQQQRKLVECEKVLDWFRQQKDCSVEPIGDGPGVAARYVIYWQFDLIWFDLSTELTDITWDYRSGTLEQLKKIKAQYIEEERKAKQRTTELLKCREVLDWFRQQEYCTVKPFKYNGGKIAGYKISWRIKYSELAKVIWDGNKRTIVPGKYVDINGSGTWNSDFGTYKQLVELKERFEDQKVTFGPK